MPVAVETIETAHADRARRARLAHSGIALPVPVRGSDRQSRPIADRLRVLGGVLTASRHREPIADTRPIAHPTTRPIRCGARRPESGAAEHHTTGDTAPLLMRRRPSEHPGPLANPPVREPCKTKCQAPELVHTTAATDRSHRAVVRNLYRATHWPASNRSARCRCREHGQAPAKFPS